MKNIFYFNNIILYTIIYLILITNIKSLQDSDFIDLESKTLDTLRQIVWNAFKVFRQNYYIGYLKALNNNFDSIWKAKRREEIIRILKRELKTIEKVNIWEEIKKNEIFKIENLTSLKNLVKDKNIHKNYIINIAFNIDKYDRTKKQAINSVSDYINFYKREEIEEFINQKLDEYFNENTSKEDLEKIVLNNYKFDYTNINSYINKKTKEELIQLIYGYENYCFNSNDRIIEEDCKIAYSLYAHSKLDTYSLNDFGIKISTFNKKLNLENLDDFIYLIENRRFTYPNNNDLLKNLKKDELINNIMALETYYKRQTKEEKSLRKLKDYVKEFELEECIDILDWGINSYPELGEKGRFQDIISSETNLQYSEVKSFLSITEREQLLQYAYNIYTYQNNITSIYDKSIYDFIRMSNNKLNEIISKDINKNKELQEKKGFLLYATLYENNIKKYLNNLQRNQLKIILVGLGNQYYNSLYESGQITVPSRKKELVDSLKYYNNYVLIEKILDFSVKLQIKNSTDIFSKDINKENYINKYFSYNENIMDFFRSTDIYYLRLWLRKYELIIRKLKFNDIYISGGLKTNFVNLNEYTKNEILNNFDIYIYEYPELFSPENFIKYVGLDTGITSHKYLVENAENIELIKKIAYSMIGHMQRKNIQTNFRAEEAITTIITSLESVYDDEIYIKNKYLYQLFRLINILPELNNFNLFYNICVNDETRIINMMELDNKNIEDFIFNDTKLDKMKENIKYYYDKKLQKIVNEIDSKECINNFLNNIKDDIVKSRVLDGDLYQIIYDYSLYLKDEKEVVINNIYNILIYEKKIINTDNLTKSDDKIKAISEAINKYSELQNSTYFDEKYNFIEIKSEGYLDLQTLFKFLQESDNRYIFYYCLIANILKYEKNNELNNVKENIKDIYLNIHYMSRVSMIRYILNVAKLKGYFEEKLSPNNLKKLVKKYMLDIGSDNIYDLTFY